MKIPEGHEEALKRILEILKEDADDMVKSMLEWSNETPRSYFADIVKDYLSLLSLIEKLQKLLPETDRKD